MLLLQVLRDREDYGYSVVVRLQDSGVTDLGEGTVYPALSRLESSGLLTARLVPSASGPARKYYTITAAGLAELGRSVGAWRSLVDAVDGVIPERSRDRSR